MDLNCKSSDSIIPFTEIYQKTVLKQAIKLVFQQIDIFKMGFFLLKSRIVYFIFYSMYIIVLEEKLCNIYY